jgi:hypothetical protein
MKKGLAAASCEGYSDTPDVLRLCEGNIKPDRPIYADRRIKSSLPYVGSLIVEKIERPINVFDGEVVGSNDSNLDLLLRS